MCAHIIMFGVLRNILYIHRQIKLYILLHGITLCFTYAVEMKMRDF